jgi:plastocyanin
MEAMKGARALAGGMLVLASVCMIPAVSAAQDAAAPEQAATTTTSDSVLPPETGTSVSSGAPPEGASAGDLSPITESAVQDSGRSSVGVPAAAPADTAAGASDPVAQASASASVTMADFFFSPASVTVAVGDSVTWRNEGDAPHNASGDDGSFRTPDLNKGQSASESFNSPGTFSYICTIHPQMKGPVRVISGGGGSGGGGSGGGSAGSTSSGSAPSEASAVASPDAAGDANTLPMTGLASGAMALVGLALLASGLLARQAERTRRRRWLSPF